MIQAARQLAAQTVNLTGVIVQGILASGHAPSPDGNATQVDKRPERYTCSRKVTTQRQNVNYRSGL